jgi:hypothetical protein
MWNPGNTDEIEDEHEQSSNQAVPQSELDRWMDDGGHCPDQAETGISHEK